MMTTLKHVAQESLQNVGMHSTRTMEQPNSGTYHRTKAQKRPEGSRQSAFDRSAMDASPIEYKTTGSKI